MSEQSSTENHVSMDVEQACDANPSAACCQTNKIRKPMLLFSLAALLGVGSYVNANFDTYKEALGFESSTSHCSSAMIEEMSGPTCCSIKNAQLASTEGSCPFSSGFCSESQEVLAMSAEAEPACCSQMNKAIAVAMMEVSSQQQATHACTGTQACCAPGSECCKDGVCDKTGEPCCTDAAKTAIAQADTNSATPPAPAMPEDI